MNRKAHLKALVRSPCIQPHITMNRTGLYLPNLLLEHSDWFEVTPSLHFGVYWAYKETNTAAINTITKFIVFSLQIYDTLKQFGNKNMYA